MDRTLEAGLALIELLLDALPGYHAAQAAATDLFRRAGRPQEASAHYRAAAALAHGEPERRYLLRRLAEVCAQHISQGLSKAFQAIRLRSTDRL